MPCNPLEDQKMCENTFRAVSLCVFRFLVMQPPANRANDAEQTKGECLSFSDWWILVESDAVTAMSWILWVARPCGVTEVSVLAEGPGELQVRGSV